MPVARVRRSPAKTALSSLSVDKPFVTRFAPSPNGELHLGHALSAITAFEFAQRAAGRFLLRIEDIDTQRTREDHVAQIYTDLRWLGLSWEEPVMRQSLRFGAYRAAAGELLQRGILYPCFATRSEIETAVALSPEHTDPDGAPLYPGLCKGLARDDIERHRAAGEPYCLRIDMDRAYDAVRHQMGGRPLTFLEWDGEPGNAPVEIPADPRQWGDAVIVRKDTPASYHLAVVVDDAAQGVSHVIRGRDLYAATSIHRLLQVLLGLPQPVYHHHRLVLDSTGRKLAKSLRDTSLRTLRDDGTTPAAIRQRLGMPPSANEFRR
jgi:glutamyl-Q tRNA(Asp) synthetase